MPAPAIRDKLRTRALAKARKSRGPNAHAMAPDAPNGAPTARYEQVKQYIRNTIESGERRAGDRIPSELDLVESLGVSRMTVNRALRELTNEGLLTRVGCRHVRRRIQAAVDAANDRAHRRRNPLAWP